MKTNLQIAIDFVQKIHKEHVLQAVLFGSVARGEDTKTSDIDVAIIHDSKDEFQIKKDINHDTPENVQITFLHVSKLPSETEIAGALSGEGLLLYGSPVLLQEKKLGLSPKMLISYTLSSLAQTQKVKLIRAFYGSLSKSSSQGKEYKTQTKGIANAPGIEKLNNGVLLVERRLATKLINTLKRFHAEYQEIPVWTY